MHLAAPRSGLRTTSLLIACLLALLGEATAQAQLDWVKVKGFAPPAANMGHAMAYDVARQRTVLFGGADQNNSLVSGTREWNGHAWTERPSTSSPSNRLHHAMTYDLFRARVVLFGGMDGSGALADTWEWDGKNWTRQFPTTSPGQRQTPVMCYDMARQRVVLFSGNHTTADTWEWDGKAWSRRSTSKSPSPRYYHAIAYDMARQRIFLFGGLLQGRLLADTWEYGGVLPTSKPFGSACSGTNSAPILTSQVPYLGHLAFGFELMGARPDSACVFGLSTGRQDQLLSPCTLYLQSPILPLFGVTNQAGFARSQTFAIPQDGNLRGLELYAQAVVADPQGPVGGLTFSGGLKLVLGD